MKSLFFSIYNEEEIDKDLELETVVDTMRELSIYLNKPRKTLYNLGIKKVQGLRTYINIDNKKYVIIVDKDKE